MNPRPPSSGLVGFRIVLVTDISVIAVLDDPVRRRLYDYVAAQGAGVSRSEAAQAAGIGRTLAAFHLDRLAETGLVEVTFARPGGRSARRHAPRPPGGDLVTAALTAQGYQPYRDGGDIRLRNCPFHLLASNHPPLICGMNLALLEGLLAGAAVPGLSARFDPRPEECCVVLAASKNNEH